MARVGLENGRQDAEIGFDVLHDGCLIRFLIACLDVADGQDLEARLQIVGVNLLAKDGSQVCLELVACPWRLGVRAGARQLLEALEQDVVRHLVKDKDIGILAIPLEALQEGSAQCCTHLREVLAELLLCGRIFGQAAEVLDALALEQGCNVFVQRIEQMEVGHELLFHDTGRVALAVELQRVLEIAAHGVRLAVEFDHAPRLLRAVVDAVCAGNRLDQRVGLHDLVHVEDVEVDRVEARQQLVDDDDEVQALIGVLADMLVGLLVGESGRQIALEMLVVRVRLAVELCLELLVVASDDCDEPFFLVDDARCILVDIRVKERRDVKAWCRLLEELPVGIGLGDGTRGQHPVEARAVLTAESHCQAVVQYVLDDSAAVRVAVVVGCAEEVLDEVFSGITIGTKRPQKSATTSVAASLGSFLFGLVLLVMSTNKHL